MTKEKYLEDMAEAAEKLLHIYDEDTLEEIIEKTESLANNIKELNKCSKK